MSDDLEMFQNMDSIEYAAARDALVLSIILNDDALAVIYESNPEGSRAQETAYKRAEDRLPVAYQAMDKALLECGAAAGALEMEEGSVFRAFSEYWNGSPEEACSGLPERIKAEKMASIPDR